MENVGNKKLNPLHVQNYIEVKISEIKPTPAKTFHICLYEGILDVHPTGHTKLPHQIYLKFTEDDLRKGFTSGQWNKLTGQFTTSIEKGELCQRHLKL